MGRIVAFSEFADYYAPLREREEFAHGTILDTNVLIALTYEVNANNEEVVRFFETALSPEQDRGFRLFTTVNTRSEYLDFYRRLIKTENLRDLVDENSKWKVPAKARAQIQYQSGILKAPCRPGTTRLSMLRVAFAGLESLNH